MMMFGLCRACRDGLSLRLLSRSNALGGEEGRPENPVGMHKNKINKLRALFLSIFPLLFPLFVSLWFACMDGGEGGLLAPLIDLLVLIAHLILHIHH